MRKEESMDLVTEQSQPTFVPYDTMWKLSLTPFKDELVNKSVTRQVQCVNCGTRFPLGDLLEGELNEENCHVCKTTCWEFYEDQDHRKVEDNAD